MWVVCHYDRIKEYVYEESAFLVETMEDGIMLLSQIVAKTKITPSFTHVNVLQDDKVVDCKNIVMYDNLIPELSWILKNLKYYAH